MYNYSRLCQIWTAYEKGVVKNIYTTLPDTDTINFALLNSEVSSLALEFSTVINKLKFVLKY